MIINVLLLYYSAHLDQLLNTYLIIFFVFCISMAAIALYRFRLWGFRLLGFVFLFAGGIVAINAAMTKGEAHLVYLSIGILLISISIIHGTFYRMASLHVPKGQN